MLQHFLIMYYPHVIKISCPKLEKSSIIIVLRAQFMTSPFKTLTRHVIRPAVRFCLRHGITAQELIEALKREFIREASDAVSQRKEKATVSRLSAITGFNRREVERVLTTASDLDTSKSLIHRVLSTWQSDPDFLTAHKAPRVLTHGTRDSEFTTLVGKVSKDLNPAAVLAELLRVKAAKETPNGVSLVVHNYIPKGDPNAIFSILSNDLEDLTVAVEDNALLHEDPPHLHLRTEYDRIRPEGIPELKRWFLREGHEFHLRARAEMAKHDQDVTPDPNFKGPGVRVVVTAFSLVAPKERDEV
jgi:hypothetical protein